MPVGAYAPNLHASYLDDLGPGRFNPTNPVPVVFRRVETGGYAATKSCHSPSTCL